MTRAITRSALPVLGLLLAAACTRLTPEQLLAQDIAEALGGVDRVKAARLLTLEGTGRQYNLGQDLKPGLADQTFTVSAYTREIDLSRHRMRTTLTRTPNFAYFQGPQAQTQVQGLDAMVAYGGSDPAKLARNGAAAVADRRAERFHHPLVVAWALVAGGAKVTAMRTEGAERILDVETDAGPVTMAVGADARPTRIETRGAHPNLGDVVMTTTFSNYQESNGWRLPATFTTRVDDFTTGEYTVTSRTAETGSPEAPPAVADAAEPAPPAVNVAVEEVAPGVWFLAGQSHHSVAVAFKDRLVLVEAPQSEARSLAVIARARELRPGTPLTHLVMSHHHFDHSTGLRAAIAEGLTIVTHEGNDAFVKAMAARPFTRQPDALARAAKPVTVEAVGASRTITDGTRTLELHHVAGNPHSETMLMAWLPKERLLIEVDAFSPGGTYHPYAANLLAHIERLKLKVDRIVPLHGGIVTMKDLMAAAKPAA
jgi:glyoxylase-like metal-dependent hydrolase (beta-lactamase superfamily II)